MRVEFSRLSPNPWQRDWKNALPLLVTGSPIREQTARFCKTPLVPSSLLAEINHGVAEDRTKGEIGGNGVVTPVRREVSSPHLTVEIATDKAVKALQYFLSKPEPPSSFAAIDSTWAVNYPPENLLGIGNASLIHKPNGGKNGIDLIITELQKGALQGANLQSVSGICVIQIRPNREIDFRQFLMIVDYGPINHDADWQRLANLIASNGRYAAGISTPYLFYNIQDLVTMPPFIKVNIFDFGRRDSKYIPFGSSGSIISSRVMLELGANLEDLPSIIAMSLGLLPQT